MKWIYRKQFNFKKSPEYEMKNEKNSGILTKFKIVPPGMTGDAISIPTKTRFTMPKPQYG